jgi:hypothetical protein
LQYDATFELRHDRDEIYAVSAKLKDVVGRVDNLVVLEKAAFEILLANLKE